MTKTTYEALLNPIGDLGTSASDTDIAPTHVMEQANWTDHQRRQLRRFSQRLDQPLPEPKMIRKLYAASIVLEDWISNGFQPGSVLSLY